MGRQGTHLLLLDPPSVPSRGSLKRGACQAGGGFSNKRSHSSWGGGRLGHRRSQRTKVKQSR